MFVLPDLGIKAEIFSWSLGQNLGGGGCSTAEASGSTSCLRGTAAAAVHSSPSAEKLFFEKLPQTKLRKHQNVVNASIDFALLNSEK